MVTNVIPNQKYLPPEATSLINLQMSSMREGPFGSQCSKDASDLTEAASPIKPRVLTMKLPDIPAYSFSNQTAKQVF